MHTYNFSSIPFAFQSVYAKYLPTQPRRVSNVPTGFTSDGSRMLVAEGFLPPDDSTPNTAVVLWDATGKEAKLLERIREDEGSELVPETIWSGPPGLG